MVGIMGLVRAMRHEGASTMGSGELWQNPRAAALAKQFGVLYEEVALLFERGYAPSEIERAYRMGKSKDADAADVLAMRDAGMDWREIDKALVTVPDFVAE